MQISDNIPWNYTPSPYKNVLYMPFKKEISIQSHRAKSYSTGNFRKTACPKKHLALKSYIRPTFFFAILKTVLIVDLQHLSLSFKLKKCRIYRQNSLIISPKNSLKTMFFLHIPGCYKQLCKYWRALYVLLYDLECYFFLNDVDIQLQKHQFWKISSSMCYKSLQFYCGTWCTYIYEICRKTTLTQICIKWMTFTFVYE